MAIVPYAQQYQVQGGNRPLEHIPHCGLVFLGSLPGLNLAPHAMHLLRWYRNMVYQSLPGHAIVAVRVVWRYATFIAPENVPPLPGYALGVR